MSKKTDKVFSENFWEGFLNKQAYAFDKAAGVEQPVRTAVKIREIDTPARTYLTTNVKPKAIYKLSEQIAGTEYLYVSSIINEWGEPETMAFSWDDDIQEVTDFAELAVAYHLDHHELLAQLNIVIVEDFNE